MTNGIKVFLVSRSIAEALNNRAALGAGISAVLDRLQTTKQFSRRRTIQPSLLQSLLVWERCGYNLYWNSSSRGESKRYY
jgi:hypothetical protein